MAASDSTAPVFVTTVSSTGVPSAGMTSTTTETRSFTVMRPRGAAGVRALDVVGAVYAHIQAVRSLGREQVSAGEIAQALDLPQNVVLDAVARLRDRGVRVIG